MNKGKQIKTIKDDMTIMAIWIMQTIAAAAEVSKIRSLVLGCMDPLTDRQVAGIQEAFE